MCPSFESPAVRHLREKSQHGGAPGPLDPRTLFGASPPRDAAGAVREAGCPPRSFLVQECRGLLGLARAAPAPHADREGPGPAVQRERPAGDCSQPAVFVRDLLSGRSGSNRRHSAWEADTLPTELRPRESGGLSLGRPLVKRVQSSPIRSSKARSMSSCSAGARAVGAEGLARFWMRRSTSRKPGSRFWTFW